MMNNRLVRAALLLWLVSLALHAHAESAAPEVVIGKRLFLETRFAQAFFAQCHGDVNATVAGDPALDQTVTAGSALPGAFAGKTMSCRVCHFEDEQQLAPGGGVRTYCDFARRSPIPERNDGKHSTVRNSPTLVAAALPRQQFFLHFDGEFPTPEDLALGTFTGRNYGWLASEHAAAVKHIANVIRGDNGQGELAQAYGGAYAKIFAADPSVPAQFLLPPAFRLDVARSPDAKVMSAAAKLIGAYLRSLDFSRDGAGNYNGSPYDLFLIKNNLPQKGNAGESDRDYSRRLGAALNALAAPVFVTPADGSFSTHAIPFVFGPDELAGMKLFFADGAAGPAKPPPPPPSGAPGAAPLPPGGSGNCVTCHAAPNFTDFRFHNTGVSQLEYDAQHGDGAFFSLKIPSLAERTKSPTAALPASAIHPGYSGAFRSIPSPTDPALADLGLWNVYANKDIPHPQKALKAQLQLVFGKLKDDALLDQTIATFKTPGLRDLGHSQPYQHNGSLDNIQGVMQFYLQVSDMARRGLIRNPDPQLAGIALNPTQAAQIAKFLNALNEDFQD